MDRYEQMIVHQTAVALASTTPLISIKLKGKKRLLSAKDKDKKFAFPPASISVMLRLIAAGSDGQTLDELLFFLKCNRNEFNDLAAHLGTEVLFADRSVSFVDGAWSDCNLPLTKDTWKVVKGVYTATITQVDFLAKADEVIQQVNSYGKKVTNGRVKAIITRDSVKFMAKFILANAIYFKEISLLDEFSAYKGPFMTRQMKKDFPPELPGFQFKVLQLPYMECKNNKCQFSLSLYFPDTEDGLTAMTEALDVENAIMKKQIQKARRRKLANPKFTSDDLAVVTETLLVEAASLRKQNQIITSWKLKKSDGLAALTDTLLVENACLEKQTQKIHSWKLANPNFKKWDDFVSLVFPAAEHMRLCVSILVVVVIVYVVSH